MADMKRREHLERRFSMHQQVGGVTQQRNTAY